MDDEKANAILERLDRLESKMDTMLTFTETLQGLARAWMSGGRGKMLATLARIRGGDGT